MKQITDSFVYGTMKVSQIIDLLDAQVLTTGPSLEGDVKHAFSSDLMSDVLTRDHHKTVLITGLSNLQAIRTAEMSEIGHVIIARDKAISKEMVELAEQSDIVLIKSSYSMFRISGMLFQAGIKPLF
ncbi:MAG: hypothetical protein R2751_01650 [Bacteroidales bacterium]